MRLDTTTRATANGARLYNLFRARRGSLLRKMKVKNSQEFSYLRIDNGPSGRNQARPVAWCGWEMRRLVGVDPGPSFNLARNWAHWGRPGPAGIGAVVVWPHHVGKIVGQQNGEWIVESGNDGHALRTRPRSIAGAIAIRWS